MCAEEIFIQQRVYTTPPFICQYLYSTVCSACANMATSITPLEHSNSEERGPFILLSLTISLTRFKGEVSTMDPSFTEEYNGPLLKRPSVLDLGY